MTQLSSPPMSRADITVREPDGARKIERRLTVVITVIPFLGVIAGIILAWGRGFSWIDLMIFGFCYVVALMGVTVGFHRLLTHRSFDTRRFVRVVLAIAGSFAVQGGVIKWVADHRRHHAFTDKPGDPHSPHLEEAEGVKGVIAGLWHAHWGWFFDRERTNIPRFAPDLLKDRALVIVDKLTPLWIVLSFVFPALLGLAITRSFWGMVTAFIWGGLVRMFLLHHVSWSINSICHFYGSKDFEADDESTNNWVMAVLSLGEGWHNNHHAFPSSAIHGLKRWQIDPSALTIKLLKALRLAWNVKVPSPQQMALKRARV